jgi:1-pyrroline-4-hydroxy-2-carboxylate deaminase
MHVNWKGIFPAVTTQFKSDQSLDVPATTNHLGRLLEAGMDGLIMLGTVGENCSLEPAEKRAVMRLAVERAKGRVPVLSGVAEYTTAGACRYAAEMATLGVDGLMVLPAMVYKSDARETLAHFRAVARSSDLPIMVYNNPIAYGVDVTPDMFEELADEPALVAINESSDNVRRVTEIIARTGGRYAIFCGVDDLAMEAMLMGACGWVAGLVDAFPRETVAIYRLISDGRIEEARAIYRWFSPLLHLDVSRKLVQNVKLVEAIVGVGTEIVRPPRLPLAGEERAQVIALVEQALKTRPVLPAVEFA